MPTRDKRTRSSSSPKKNNKNDPIHVVNLPPPSSQFKPGDSVVIKKRKKL